jgi:CRP-like cAMP-binding protein
VKGRAKQPGLDIEHLCTRHRLLSRLSGTDRRRMARKMQVVSLSALHPLYEMSGVISNVFFPLSAVLFFLGTTIEGHVVEVGQVGSEGVAGVEVAMRTPSAGMSLMTAAIQIPGMALQMNADDFAEEVDRHSAVNRCVRRYLAFFLSQLQFLIACNRHHNVEQRGARWLLALQDRTRSRTLRLTQQHLADMLGITRQSAERLLNDFQVAKILNNQRGSVTIMNRSRLHERACDCYRLIAKRLKGVFV